MPKQMSWQDTLAGESFRSKVHLCFMLLGAVVLYVYPPALGAHGDGLAVDKSQHYQGGKLISTAVFFVGYALLALKFFVWGKGSLTLRLLWLPTWYGLLATIALFVVGIFAGGKELIDSTGLGNVEMKDFLVTLDGAWMPHIGGVVFLLGLSPILIPLDMLLQWPASMGKGVRSGKEDVDVYVQEKKSHQEKKATVLVLEDDLQCAGLLLKFFKRLKMNCIHVDTVRGASQAMDEHGESFQLLILDCFVRVDESGDRRTGAEWLEELVQKDPVNERAYKVVITTGHPEQLEHRADFADLVLPKPWSPETFLKHIKAWSLIKT